MTPLSTLDIGKERRVFYSASEAKNIGLGVAICRGYFQSLRPAISRILLNVDSCAVVVYRAGPLIELACEYMGLRNTFQLVERLRAKREREKLGHFITGVRVEWQSQGAEMMTRTVKGLGDSGADRENFTRRDGSTATVAAYFSERLKRPLNYPGLPCIQVR